MLELQNIKGGYIVGNDILNGVDLSIHMGEAVGIIGLNGSGKSTLGKAIMNMLTYQSGELIFKNEIITKLKTNELSRKGLSFFLQGGQIFDDLSVWDNLLLSANGYISDITLIQEYFSLLRGNKNKFKNLGADKLSGGERHQLALAMCLLRKPSFLILDEPSAGLSPAMAKSLYEVLTILRKEQNLTILLIEQNIALAIDFCNKIYLLDRGKISRQFDKKDITEIEIALFKP